MRADKIREYDNAELVNRSREAEEQLFRLRFQMGMGQFEGVKKYRELKRDRARMLLVLREREIDPSKAPAPAAKPTKKSKKEK
jgi:large subunit ribosomal protein L29